MEIKQPEWCAKHYVEERRQLERFLDITRGTVSFESLKKYIKEINRYAKRRAYVNTVCRFLEFVAKKKNYNVKPFVELLKEIKPPKKEKKLFADSEEDEAFTFEEIQEPIRIIAQTCKPLTALKAISLIVFMATTGVRPEEACAKSVSGIYTPGIQKSMFDLSRDYIILPAEISKTRYKRVLPIHPQLKPLIGILLKVWPKDDLWNYNTIRKVIQETQIRQLKRLRKFFVRYSAEINFPEAYRIAMAGHDESELMKLRVTEEFYRKFTPDKIVEKYMEYWGQISVIPDDFRLI